MELEVPPCSDSQLAALLDKWTRRAITREPLALAMARAFARETGRRLALRRTTMPRPEDGKNPAH